MINTKVQEDSYAEVKRVVERFVDPQGRVVTRVSVERVEKPIDLGSLNNPKNEDIVEIKSIIPRKRDPIFDGLFDGLFGGKR